MATSPQPGNSPSGQVFSHDLEVRFASSSLSSEVLRGTLGYQKAAARVGDLLIQEAAAIKRGDRKVLLTSPFEARTAGAPVVDSLDFQRAAIEHALALQEKKIDPRKYPRGMKDTVVLGGPRSSLLARQVAVCLGMRLGKLDFHSFPGSEFKFEVKESVRRKDVYVVMSTGNPAAENVLSLCILADALVRAKAASITAVIPMFGFARQDRRDKGKREPISAELVARLLEASGIKSTMTMDIHAPQEEGFFKRLDPLYASSVLVPWVKPHIDPAESVMLSPDAGGIKRAEHYGYLFGIEDVPVWIHKVRIGDSSVKMSRLAGSVKGKTVIIADDLISTATTIAEAAQLAMDEGAKEVIVVATHPVFAANAYEKLARAPIKKIIVAETTPVYFPTDSRFESVPPAPLLAEAIRLDHTGGSVSKLLSKTFPLSDLKVPWLSFDPMTAMRSIQA